MVQNCFNRLQQSNFGSLCALALEMKISMEKKFLRINLCVKIILGKFGSLETNAVESPFSDVKSEDLVNIKVYKKGLGNIEDHIIVYKV